MQRMRYSHKSGHTGLPDKYMKMRGIFPGMLMALACNSCGGTDAQMQASPRSAPTVSVGIEGRDQREMEGERAEGVDRKVTASDPPEISESQLRERLDELELIGKYGSSHAIRERASRLKGMLERGDTDEDTLQKVDDFLRENKE